MSSDPILEFRNEGRITIGVIRAASVLDAVNVNEFGQQVLDYVKQHPNIHLLLDFENVNYLSSAVLTELLRIKETAQKSGGDLRLCSLNPDIQKVFEITNLDKIFVIYDAPDVAVQRYERSLNIEAQEKAWGDI